MTELTTMEVPDFVNDNPVLAALIPSVVEGINEIHEANEVLLAEKKGTGDREIDKILKAAVDNENLEDLPDEVSENWTKAVEAKKVYQEFVNKARNAYRVEVLDEEASEEVDVDKDALKETRATVQNSLSLLKAFAEGNGLVKIVEWINTVEIPMVGRKGSTSTEGVKRHRVFVTNEETGEKYDSFTAAATALSDKENKVTPAELSALWDEVDGSSIEWNDVTLVVEKKNKG